MRQWMVVVAGAVVVLAAACDSSGEEATPILAPGAPGESASPATDEQLEAAEELGRHNEADVEFVLQMIVHHEQALEMTDLVPDRYDNDDINTIASRMSSAQELEIATMEDWLERSVYGPARENPAHQNYCGLEEQLDQDGHHGGDCVLVELDHDDMPGMATAEELDDLADADGAEFDELFVELMVTHHEGAIEMSLDLLDNGQQPQVVEMAGDIATEQQVEINRLRGILGDE